MRTAATGAPTCVAVRDGAPERSPPRSTGRPSEATAAIAGESPLSPGVVMSSGVRTTAANRKNARPNMMNRSPKDATFWISGSGIGMMSASGPRWSRKLASSVAGRTVLIADGTSEGEKPAATRLGSQIGMYPPLARMTRAFERVPTKAIVMPG